MQTVHFVALDGELVFASRDESEVDDYIEDLANEQYKLAREELGYDDDDFSERHSFDAALVASESDTNYFTLDVPDVLVGLPCNDDDPDVDDWQDEDQCDDYYMEDVVTLCRNTFCISSDDEFADGYNSDDYYDDEDEDDYEDDYESDDFDLDD